MTLQYLDIGIAVAVVMLAVSLLITILVQLVASVLALRGSNLRWAVTTLIKQVHPKFEEDARAIANEVLTHPLISDSTLSRFAQLPVIGQICRRWSLASAVRIEELVGVMDVISPPIAPGTVSPPEAEGLQSVEKTTPVTPKTDGSQSVGAKTKTAAEQDRARRRAAMATISLAAKTKMGPQVGAVARQTKDLLDGLKGAAPIGTIDIDRLLEKIPGAAETVFGTDLKSWFNSMMDRATQRFTMQMRVVTVVISIATAFVLHLDAFKLFSDLSTSPDIRASLVAQSDAIQKIAGEVLTAPTGAAGSTGATGSSGTAGSSGTSGATANDNRQQKPPATVTPAHHVPDVYREALVELLESTQTAADAAEKAAKAASPDLAEAAKKASVAALAARYQANLLKPVGDLPSTTLFASRAEAVAWLNNNGAGQLEAGYETTVDRLLKDGSETDKLLDHAKQVKSVVDATRYRLVPDPYPGLTFRRWREIAGILFAAGLLALGAPFWFNALQAMTALRPILASKQDKETKSPASR